MTSLSAPWIVLTILCCLVGSVWVRTARNPDTARRRSLLIGVMTLFLSIVAWWDFRVHHPLEAHDGWDVLGQWNGEPVFVLDFVTAPLLPLASLLYLIIALATQRTKVQRFSFAGLLVSETILLATFCTRQPWAIVALLLVGALPPYFELRARRKPTRVFVIHMALFSLLLVTGQALLTARVPGAPTWATLLLAAAVLLRSGIVPLHCWMTDLFEHAAFGTALLFTTPMVGAYAAVRLVLPLASDWVLGAIALLAIVTALYAAGMALVQREARRFFSFIFLSNSSLVFVGLATVSPISLTGALCLWLSVGMSMAGFGLTLRSVEARTGRLTLDKFHGLYEHTPALAALFLLAGLASIGFPGTVGFVGTELLVDGVVQVAPLMGIAIVIASALNGLAVLQAYFRVFTGTRHGSTVDLGIRRSERAAVLVLTGLILGGGLYPQPGVASRHQVAQQIIDQRQHEAAAQGKSAAAETNRIGPHDPGPTPLDARRLTKSPAR